jgi:hypothetical protein
MNYSFRKSSSGITARGNSHRLRFDSNNHVTVSRRPFFEKA